MEEDIEKNMADFEQSRILVDNTSPTSTANIVGNIQWDVLKNSSLRVNSNENLCPLLLQESDDGSKISNISVTNSIQSFCATPSKKEVVAKQTLSPNTRNRSNKIDKHWLADTDTDDSIVTAKTLYRRTSAFRKKSNFSTKAVGSSNYDDALKSSDESANKSDTDDSIVKAKTLHQRTSAFCKKSNFSTKAVGSSNYDVALMSSDESANKSKLDFSFDIAQARKRSAFVTRSRILGTKNSCPTVKNPYNISSSDDSLIQSEKNKRGHSDDDDDDSLAEMFRNKRTSRFCKGFVKENKIPSAHRVDYQTALNSSAESEKLSQGNKSHASKNNSVNGGKSQSDEVGGKIVVQENECTSGNIPLSEVSGVRIDQENVVAGDNNKSNKGVEAFLNQIEEEIQENCYVKDTENNSIQNSKNDIELAVTQENLNLATQKEQSGETIEKEADHSKENAEVDEDDGKLKGSDDFIDEHLDTADTENDELPKIHIDKVEKTNVSEKTLEFVNTSNFALSQPSALDSTFCNETVGRSYISNVSLQQSSIPGAKSLSFGQPNSLSSLVLRLDEYDSLDSDTEDDDYDDKNNESHYNEQINDESVQKVNETSVSGNVSSRRSPELTIHSDSGRNHSSKSTQSINERSNSNSQVDNKINSASPIYEGTSSKSLQGSNEKSFSKISSCLERDERFVQSNEATTIEINGGFDSMDVTNDTVEQSNYSSNVSNKKDESCFKVPDNSISLRNKSRLQSSKIKSSENQADSSGNSRQDSFAKNDPVLVSHGKSQTSDFSLRRSKRRSLSKNLKDNQNTSINNSYYLRQPNVSLPSDSTEQNFSNISELQRSHKNKNVDKIKKDRILVKEAFDSENIFRSKRGNNNQIKNIANDSIESSKNCKLKKPYRWITKNIYDFVISKLELKYDFKATKRAETFILFLCDKYEIVVKEKDNFKKHVDELILEMARLNLVSTWYDFYDFVEKFLPHDFVVKSVPVPQAFGKPPIVSLPSGSIFDKIL